MIDDFFSWLFEPHRGGDDYATVLGAAVWLYWYGWLWYGALALIGGVLGFGVPRALGDFHGYAVDGIAPT